jgi:hypothetical protein
MRALDAVLSIDIDASSNNIVTRNIIGGSRGMQIIDQGACCNQVIGNWFGVTPDGRTIERPFATNNLGVGINESFNRVAGNIFGGINYSNVRVFGLGSNVLETIVAGNTFLGITPTQPILAGAVDVDGGSRTFIGGTTEQFRNRINAGATGIQTHDGVDRTFILGNSIGNDDQTSMQNTHGIDTRSSNFTFVQGNTIANGSGRGVITGVATRIRRNSLYGNRAGAIEAATSPPVIATVTSTAVSGTACARCTVEIFSDNGSQARFFEGTAVADANGRFLFTKSTILRGPNVTATASDPAGTTSALSVAVAAPPPPLRRRGVRQ